ncbi:protein of unknown function [Nitrospira japonica]|uniref:Uncharacterized protein n=1 Tax=Nitrospira japonica TaxID=1325564 RepID=A0A1W1I9F7_9BACT|nr:protein of unknown function [Nitrospira japonica]
MRRLIYKPIEFQLEYSIFVVSLGGERCRKAQLGRLTQIGPNQPLGPTRLPRAATACSGRWRTASTRLATPRGNFFITSPVTERLLAGQWVSALPWSLASLN